MKPSDLAAADGLANAPFLDKDALHAHYPFPFLTAPTPSVRRFMATSGTTGLPDDELQLVNEDTIITEILDPQTLKPVAPGEIGEIVITTLMREASPVIRWRTRDLVRLSPRPFDCRSGRRGMRKIGRIIGRTDDMIKVKGVIVFPSQIEDIVAATPGTVKEAWQIYIDKQQTTVGSMCVAIEADHRANRPYEDLAADVRREIRARLGFNALVECLPEGTLPRYEAKATRVLHRAEAGGAAATS